MAEKTKGQGAYTLLPIKDNKGNIEIVNLEYFLPWGNWLEAARLRAENERLAAIEKRAGDVGGIASELADADLEFELYCDNTKRLFAFAKASSDYILGR